MGGAGFGFGVTALGFGGVALGLDFGFTLTALGFGGAALGLEISLMSTRRALITFGAGLARIISRSVVSQLAVSRYNSKPCINRVTSAGRNIMRGITGLA